MSDSKPHYTVTVWAGSDMYTQMRVPSLLKGNPHAEYEHVFIMLQQRLEEEFGKGVELVRREEAQYDVNVDHVPVSGE